MTTITVPRAVLEQALEALEATHYDVGSAERQRLEAMDAITALRAALAQQEQEPQYTTGHCKERAKPNGCQLHNLHCGYPECDRKPVALAQQEDIAQNLQSRLDAALLLEERRQEIAQPHRGLAEEAE
jgi:hypothetical protein